MANSTTVMEMTTTAMEWEYGENLSEMCEDCHYIRTVVNIMASLLSLSVFIGLIILIINRNKHPLNKRFAKFKKKKTKNFFFFSKLISIAHFFFFLCETFKLNVIKIKIQG